MSDEPLPLEDQTAKQAPPEGTSPDDRHPENLNREEDESSGAEEAADGSGDQGSVGEGEEGA